MDYGMIGQIAKAKHYAEERHRIKFAHFEVKLAGNNNTHTVKYDGKKWDSDSSFFQQHGWSSHTVALERILAKMVEPVENGGADSINNSSMISQVEKANKYTDERHRVKFTHFTAVFAGENHDHTLTYEQGKWHCDCNFFKSHSWCSHAVALERILSEMVTPASPEHVQAAE